MISKEKYMLLLVSHIHANKKLNVNTNCKTRTCGKALVVFSVAMSSASSSVKVACQSSNRSSVR